MPKASLTWIGVCAAALAGCAGSPFTVGSADASASDASSGNDGAAADGQADVTSVDGSATPGVLCGTKTCTTPLGVCCIGQTLDCAHTQCGCETQLECAKDTDCMSPSPFCCIGSRTDITCSSGHVVARCASFCTTGSNGTVATKHMCDPSMTRVQCLTGQCSSDPRVLADVGLPSGIGYGICN